MPRAAILDDAGGKGGIGRGCGACHRLRVCLSSLLFGFVFFWDLWLIHAATARGGCANHGITDVSMLLWKILIAVASRTDPKVQLATGTGIKDAIDAYEHEMIQRTVPAVLTSRRACVDTHKYRHILGRAHWSREEIW